MVLYVKTMEHQLESMAFVDVIVGVNRLLEPKMEFRVSDINGDMAFPPLTYDLMFQQFSILWNMQRKSLLEQIHRALKIGFQFCFF